MDTIEKVAEELRSRRSASGRICDFRAGGVTPAWRFRIGPSKPNPVSNHRTVGAMIPTPPAYVPAPGPKALARRLKSLLAAEVPVACGVYIGLAEPARLSARQAEATYASAHHFANGLWTCCRISIPILRPYYG